MIFWHSLAVNFSIYAFAYVLMWFVRLNWGGVSDPPKTRCASPRPRVVSKGPPTRTVAQILRDPPKLRLSTKRERVVQASPETRETLMQLTRSLPR